MPNTEVFVEQGEDGEAIGYRMMTRMAAEDVVSPASKVVLKPNITINHHCSTGVTTHPSLLAGVAKYLSEHGVNNVTIGEGGGCDITQAFEELGFAAVAQRWGLDLADFNQDEEVEVPAPAPLADGTFGIAKTALDCDVLISVPVLKIHGPPSAVTLCLKNVMGCLVKNRSFMHQDFDRKIVSLARLLPSGLNIIDGIVAMEGQEIHGRAVGMRTVVASRDRVAADAVAAAIMGFSEGEVPHLALAAEMGLGEARLANINVVGPPISSVRRGFKRGM